MNRRQDNPNKQEEKPAEKKKRSGIRQKLKWIDPFTYVDLYVVPRVNPSKNEYVNWIIYLVFAFIFAFLFYTILGLALGTPTPMVIVVSGSMEPLYHRGDVIVLVGANSNNVQAPIVELSNDTLKETGFYEIGTANYANTENRVYVQSLQFKNGTNLPIEKTGSIVVYNSNLVNEPIIHRAVAKLHAKDGYYVLTKGDSIHNNTFDQDCGRIFPYGPERQCITLYPVPIGELQGVSVLQIPIVGCAKLWLFDNLGSLISTGKLPSNFSGIC